jgi:prepilin-type N-terminal cleavage/methylation domain-containing protein
MTIRRRRLQDERGFTFLEVMVALVMVSGVLVTVITTMNLHLSRVADAKAEFEVLLLAREKIEDIRLGIEKEASSGKFGPAREGLEWEYDERDAGFGGDVEPVNVKLGALSVKRAGQKDDIVKLSFYEAG